MYKYQSCFRSHFSTDTCRIYFTDLIRFRTDKGQYVGLVLLDLQKAFATVDHNILLMKLEAIVLNQDVVRLFRSYLAERQQLVDVSGMLSSSAESKCGVSRGSLFGPLLFLIYVNGMSDVNNNKRLLYAILVADKQYQIFKSC